MHMRKSYDCISYESISNALNNGESLANMKVEDSINDIIKNVEKLSNHLNAYKTYHDKLVT